MFLLDSLTRRAVGSDAMQRADRYAHQQAPRGGAGAAAVRVSTAGGTRSGDGVLPGAVVVFGSRLGLLAALLVVLPGLGLLLIGNGPPG